MPEVRSELAANRAEARRHKLRHAA
jgi:hypothetical protein